MRPIAILVAVGALLAADAASAAVVRAHLAPHRVQRLHRTRHLVRRPKLRLHATAATLHAPPGAAARRVYTASANEAGAPRRAGFYKSTADREAGWGFDHGRMKTVVGVYQRPAEAGEVPGPQIYHNPEGRGAAGLALSFKLGK